MTDRQQRIQERKAMIISLGVHGVVFLLLLFLVAWRAPNPPHPEYGIELNFGMDAQGSGEIQPTEPVGSGDSEEQPESEVQANETSSPEDQPIEDAVPDPAPTETEPLSKVESPVVVEEKTDSKPAEKTTDTPVDKPVETEKPKTKEVPKAVYSSKSDTDGTKGKDGETVSQGDSKHQSGDQGDPEGTLDAKALYGKQGGGDGGPALQLAGWDWDHIPKPVTPDNEPSGRIVFTIEVDDNGELVRYRKESGTVSAAAERACIEAIQKLTFTKKSGAKVPAISKGTITFVIRSE